MNDIDTKNTVQTASEQWQLCLANAVRHPQKLLEQLQLTSDPLWSRLLTLKSFPLLAPQPFVSRMRMADPHDPLLRQVLPVVDEQTTSQTFIADPLQEQRFSTVPGILHKYHGRVLLIAATGCAVHCRYCFRREFPYSAHQTSTAAWQEKLEYIQRDDSIREVILSGGDPLMHTDVRLFQLIDAIADIAHVKRLRIHTRLPIMIPERITTALIEGLQASRLQTVLVLHTNHPNEMDQAVHHATNRLWSAGIHLLNQTVLLKGVNDHADTLVELSERLFEVHVMPYYVHRLDPVIGTTHFAVPLETATQIFKKISAKLPGFLVPKFVQEIPGNPSKTLIAY